MRENLNKIDMNGVVVIGEGELDKAPMLYTGEKLGNKKGPEFDIAVDPLEGTNFAANNLQVHYLLLLFLKEKFICCTRNIYGQNCNFFARKRDC